MIVRPGQCVRATLVVCFQSLLANLLQGQDEYAAAARFPRVSCTADDRIFDCYSPETHGTDQHILSRDQQQALRQLLRNNPVYRTLLSDVLHRAAVSIHGLWDLARLPLCLSSYMLSQSLPRTGRHGLRGRLVESAKLKMQHKILEAKTIDGRAVMSQRQGTAAPQSHSPQTFQDQDESEHEPSDTFSISCYIGVEQRNFAACCRGAHLPA